MAELDSAAAVILEGDGLGDGVVGFDGDGGLGREALPLDVAEEGGVTPLQSCEIGGTDPHTRVDPHRHD